jgi:hypothetical protein
VQHLQRDLADAGATRARAAASAAALDAALVFGAGFGVTLVVGSWHTWLFSGAGVAATTRVVVGIAAVKGIRVSRSFLATVGLIRIRVDGLGGLVLLGAGGRHGEKTKKVNVLKCTHGGPAGWVLLTLVICQLCRQFGWLNA